MRLTNAVGKTKAMEMCLTGELITAEDALKWGLVSQVLPDQESLLKEAFRIATVIASKSQIAAAFTKRAIKSSLGVGESAALDHERSLFIAAMATHDKQEGIKAFLEKRKPQFKDQ